MSLRPGIAALIAVLACLVPAAAANADFTPPVEASGSPTVQADLASQPAISADGRYIAFTGSQAGVQGIFREDLATGAIDEVAAGSIGNAALGVPPSVGAPSISGDGRYISFTTTVADPFTGAGSQCSSVYVRDMDEPLMVTDPQTGQPVENPAAFTLASALNGSTTGLTYAGSGTGGCPGGGSSSAGNVALSGDGSEVAFTVVGESNLTTRASGQATTPPAQVVVRNLITNQTTLVSQTMASLGAAAGPQPVGGGAAVTDLSTRANGLPADADPGDSTAAISADGTTVAWLGTNIALQAPASQHDVGLGYDDVLWRRIADGPSAPTRRVICDETAGLDPTYGCNGPLDPQWPGAFPTSPAFGPTVGSFSQPLGFAAGSVLRPNLSQMSAATPQLSADGQTVAVTSTAPATDAIPSYAGGVAAPSTNPFSDDVYVVDMAGGESRTEAVTRVTQWATNDFDDLPSAGQILSLAISPEGDRVAFTTRRVVFPHSPPALITAQLSQAAFPQMYVANLADGTLELVTTGFDALPANGYVDSASFSANDGPMAFASAATNLVYGAQSDYQNGDEVFTTTEIKPPGTPMVQVIGPPPPNPTISPEQKISTSVGRAADGSVLLDVSVPGSGALSAIAKAAVPRTATAKFTRRPHQRRDRASRVHASARASAARGRSRRGGRTRAGDVVTETIASASASSAGPGVIELQLTPAPRYDAVIDAGRGLYAIVTISFRISAGVKLTEAVPVDFVAPLTVLRARERAERARLARERRPRARSRRRPSL
jgi:hypothetical protein